MHLHQFDPISGWCVRTTAGDTMFCGHRDDGRRIMPFAGDTIYAGREWTAEALTILTAKIETLLNAKYPSRRRRGASRTTTITKEPY